MLSVTFVGGAYQVVQDTPTPILERIDLDGVPIGWLWTAQENSFQHIGFD